MSCALSPCLARGLKRVVQGTFVCLMSRRILTRRPVTALCSTAMHRVRLIPGLPDWLQCNLWLLVCRLCTLSFGCRCTAVALVRFPVVRACVFLFSVVRLSFRALQSVPSDLHFDDLIPVNHCQYSLFITVASRTITFV